MIPDPSAGRSAANIAEAANALWSSHATSLLATDFAAQGIPVMVLKGPPLQQRLLGTESAYPSVDVDLLVHRRQAREARVRLRRAGWRIRPDNGLLWRLDRAQAFERNGVVIDLHWGLHLGSVPPRTLAPLEVAIWTGAIRAEGGWWEPRPEPLLVYLALHAAAFGFSKPARLLLVHGAACLVDNWVEVEALSRSVDAWPAVAHAVGSAQGDTTQRRPPLLAGVKGRLLMTGMSLVCSRLVPEPARRALRKVRDNLGARKRSGPVC